MPMRTADSILSALGEPVLLLDSRLCAVLANPAFHDALQISQGELVGKFVHELIALRDGQQLFWRILTAVLTDDSSVKDLEIECVLPPDTRLVLSVCARRVGDGVALTQMILVELRDITRERANERKLKILNDAIRQHGIELEALNKELESFTHSVSHDLRTPLRLTNKIAHLLLHDHGAQLPSGAMDKINMILDSTREMAQLIEDLLAFSQVAHEPIKKRRTDLRRLANEALSELRGEYQGRDVEIRVDELPLCLADRALLKQVMLNLLGNALKYTRPVEHASIHVGSESRDGEIVFYVRDNGIGFNMSNVESIFLAFHRLHRAQGFEGSGVGLALVKRIVERHGGRIWAEGETNLGSTFYFTLGV